MQKLSIFISLCYICLTNVGIAQQESIDSLLKIPGSQMDDSVRIHACIKLCAKLANISPDSAISFGLQGLNIAEKTNSVKDMANCYKSIADAYLKQDNYVKSMNYYLKALPLYSQLSKSADNVLSVMGKEGIAFCQTNIGVNNYSTSNYSVAMEYYQSALTIFEELNNKRWIAISYNRIGAIYRRQADYNSALDFYLKSLEINTEMSKSPDNDISALGLRGMADSYSCIGIVYYYLQKIGMVLENFKKSLEVYQKIGDTYNVSLTLGNIAELYLKQQQYSKVMEYAMQSLSTAQGAGSLESETAAYKMLSEACDSLGNPSDALKWHKLYTKTNDSLFNVQKHRQFAEMETKYQTEKKQQQIEVQKIELEKEKAEVRQQSTLKYAFIGGFLLMLILAVVILRSNRLRKKANILLTLQNNEIRQQKEEIKAQAELLNDINKELEKLSIVASETDNAVVIANTKGEIEWCNTGFEKMYGYTYQEFVCKRGRKLAEASENTFIQKFIDDCLEKKKSVIYNTVNTCSSGERLWVQTTLTPIIDENGIIKSLVAIDSDISKIKEAEEEIRVQNEEINAQNELLSDINKVLESKNIQIADSINYAKFIQEAVLPEIITIQKQLPDSFVFFRPKAIVSGDFYWFYKRENAIYIAVADCTGHGVPGAFMSMIGITMLNDIMKNPVNIMPSQIIHQLDIGISNILKKSDSGERQQDDSIEMTLCRIDTKQREVQIASARQLFLIVHNNELVSIQGDINPVGSNILFGKKDITYTDHIYPLDTVSGIYMFSDGYHDQFGGPNDQKFLSGRFRQTIADICILPMNQQYEILKDTFDQWISPKDSTRKSKSYPQTDDVLVLGFSSKNLPDLKRH